MSRRIPELLAPAGGPAELNAAIAAGADAIYCGYGNVFNARRGATNFTAETFAEACHTAHVAGVRVYVTVNVVIRDEELATALGLVRRAWLLGADAFIIQDWGLLREVHRRWPQIECHVSTQANVHDVRGAVWSTGQGASRVTLSRELSMPEIADIASAGVEVECFCHGAICICYSGICQMSSSAGNRSANRGACAQPCRLPYELVDSSGRVLSPPDRGRPLCPHDFYSFDDLPQLVGTGTSSLKVEGRLKGADYVYAVISAYREQLDDLAAGADVPAGVLQRRHTQLKRAFNRDFTNAYLMGTSGDELMSYERSNNRGELVGTVVDGRSFGSVKVRRGSTGGGRERMRTVQVADVDVRLDKPVGKGDLLELRPQHDPTQFLTAHAPQDAEAGEVITCRTTRTVERGSLVRVIRSQVAMDAGARVSELQIPRRRPVRVRIVARRGSPFEVGLETVDGMARVRVRGFVVEPARTRAVDEEDLIEHVGRMGSSPFDPVSFDVTLDEGCGMGFSAVHRVRAEACDALEHELLEPYERRALDDGLGRVSRAEASERDLREPEVCVLVANAESAHAARAAGATRVYATADALVQGSWPDDVIPVLDEVCRKADGERLDAWMCAGRPVAVGNVSHLALAREVGGQAEIRGCIPVHNRACLQALVDAGAAGVWLSPELSLDDIEQVAAGASVPVGFVVVGRSRVMTCEHCVLQVADRCVHDCARCGLRAQELFLRGDSGELNPVRTDIHGRSRVYAARETDAVPQLPQLIGAGVSRLGIDATLLSTEETVRAVRRVVRGLVAWRAGGRMPEQLPGATLGHLMEPIQ